MTLQSCSDWEWELKWGGGHLSMQTWWMSSVHYDAGMPGGCNLQPKWFATQQEQQNTKWGGGLGLQQSSCIPEVMVGTKVGDV